MKAPKSRLWVKLIIYILVLALLILTIRFIRSQGSNSHSVYVPVGFIAIFISLYLFKESNRVQKAKRDARRDYMNDHRQELLENVLKKKKENTGNK